MKITYDFVIICKNKDVINQLNDILLQKNLIRKGLKSGQICQVEKTRTYKWKPNLYVDSFVPLAFHTELLIQ